VLLREIHHLVKNNLQIIASLLSLQFANLKDPGIRTLLEDNRRRIGAMALVHGRIDLGSYIKNLTEQLFHASVRSGLIGIHLQADEVLLTPDAAIPCGLILTELISNALEYAFPAGQAGEVQIELRGPNGQEVTMVVRDIGVGFPEPLDFRHTASLGL
jgi:two-component sensor histidine kinase